MMGINLICIGKLKERYLTDACAEYIKRLGAFCRFRLIELPECQLPDRPSPAQIDAALRKGGESILSKIPRDSFVIPLCIEGKSLPSEEFSRLLSGVPLSGHSEATFIIGGSCGLSGPVKKAGHFSLSMSPMTFPHQLARVMLLEQIYRAFQIAAGGKYHK